MKITANALGIHEGGAIVRDTAGSGLLAVQLEITGTASARILGRVNPSAPWLELKETSSVDFLEAMSRVPYIALDVTAYTSGEVNLYVTNQ